MTSSALHQCSTPACPEVTRERYCVKCASRLAVVGEYVREGKITTAKKPAWAVWYRTTHWKRARREFLKQHPLCCDPYQRHVGRVEPATNVDHITPHRGNKYLFWDRKNWQPLCQSCHSYKTAKHDGGFGNADARFETYVANVAQLDAAGGITHPRSHTRQNGGWAPRKERPEEVAAPPMGGKISGGLGDEHRAPCLARSGQVMGREGNNG